jgi:hypothetical protein
MASHVCHCPVLVSCLPPAMYSSHVFCTALHASPVCLCPALISDIALFSSQVCHLPCSPLMSNTALHASPLPCLHLISATVLFSHVPIALLVSHVCPCPACISSHLCYNSPFLFSCFLLSFLYRICPCPVLISSLIKLPFSFLMFPTALFFSHVSHCPFVSHICHSLLAFHAYHCPDCIPCLPLPCLYPMSATALLASLVYHCPACISRLPLPRSPLMSAPVSLSFNVNHCPACIYV